MVHAKLVDERQSSPRDITLWCSHTVWTVGGATEFLPVAGHAQYGRCWDVSAESQ